MIRSAAATCVLLGLSLLLCGCQPRTGEAPLPTGAPADWPLYDYRQAADRGHSVYRLDTDRSRVEIHVGRAGPLARFGHEHVVVAANLEGYLALDEAVAGSRADLRFAVSGLQVDPPEARQRHGLDGEISPEDIEGTRENLMRSVLDPDRWPYVGLTISDFSGRAGKFSAAVLVEINGNRHRARAPFSLRIESGEALVEGSLALSHGELGLEPYSALGGGLRVADEMTAHFRLVGVPLP